MFGTKIDFTEAQIACDQLEREKLINGTFAGFHDDGDLDRPPFYRKSAPLGPEYDLSS